MFTCFRNAELSSHLICAFELGMCNDPEMYSQGVSLGVGTMTDASTKG